MSPDRSMRGGLFPQFRALLWKNALLLTRSRKTILGIGGWGALILQVVIPALFFFLMWVPKYYVKPISHSQQLSPTVKDLDSRWWAAVPYPYSGPAAQRDGHAHILLVPDTPAVRALAQVLARALACPPDRTKRMCPPGLPPPSFHCMFIRGDAPAECEETTSCMDEPACWSHLLTSRPQPDGGNSNNNRRHHDSSLHATSHTLATRMFQGPRSLLQEPDAPPQLLLVANMTAAMQMALERPAWVDAIVTFKHLQEAATGQQKPLHTEQARSAELTLSQSQQGYSMATRSNGGVLDKKRAHDMRFQDPGGPQLSQQLLQYSIHMNHTDVPPTRFLLDSFDVFPTRDNGLSFWQRYWFFTNLQHAINRCVLGMRATELSQGFSPPPSSPPPPPFPPLPFPPPTFPVAPFPETATSTPSQAAQATASQICGRGGSSDAIKHEVQQARLPPAPYDVTRPAPMFLSVKSFPWPPVQQDLGAASAAVFFNLLLVYAFLSPARGVVGGIVREKELRLREGMKLMGLGDGAYWGSWFLTHWSSLLLSGVLCVLVGMYPFSNTQPSVMLSFFVLFTAALVCFSYFLSTLFAASRIAGAGAQFLYALAMIPGFIAPSIAPYAGPFWYWCCLLPPGAASLWAACLVNWELVAQGLTWRTAQLPVAQGSSFCAASVLWILALDVVVYTLLAWYLDKVLPTSPSTPEHPLFFLQLFRRRPSHSTPHDNGTADGGMPHAAQADRQPLVNGMEDGMAAGIHASGLVKVFSAPGGSHVTALDGASLHVRPRSITALLGHNGAGKTTLISILTGLEAANKGNAYINGLDVAKDMHRIRQDLGVCPQFDVLWPELTVTEHLHLHASLKGYAGQERSQVVANSVQQVGLSGSESVLAGDLSGGQRRKLSLACALVGNPSVVMVDEPTSGMDPYTRRFTWDLLRAQRARVGSAILLTTHSMEEAEELADYVVIMATGRVVAQGTSQDLKAQFGEGYTLTLVTQVEPPATAATVLSDTAPSAVQAANGAAQQRHPHENAGASTASTDTDTDVAILQLVQSFVPRAVLLGRQGSQVAFRLPREDATAFPSLLRALDAAVQQHTSSQVETDSSFLSGQGVAAPTGGQAVAASRQLPSGLRVTSYGMSVTTLEEVFIHVTEGAAAAGASNSTSTSSSSSKEVALPMLPHQHALQHAHQHMHQQQGKAYFPTDAELADTAYSGPPSPPQDYQHQQQLKQRHKGLHYQRVTGWGLCQQQLYALLTKRALSARRERLTLLTQLLVPLALVALSLWVSSLSVRSPSEPSLSCDRATVLMGAPSVLAGSIAARQSIGPTNDSNWQQWLNSYSQGGIYVDSGTSRLWTSGSTAGTLDGYLLDSWYAGTAAYDAAFIDQLPSPNELVMADNGTMLKATMMLNQSAVHAIPAAVSQLANAAWHYVELATAPARGSPVQSLPRPQHWLETDSIETREGVRNPGAAAALPMTHPIPGSQPQMAVTNEPLPTLGIEPAARIRQDATGLLLVVCLTMACALMSASAAVHLVRERASKAKHVQLVSGAPPTLFWLANAIWDYLQYSCSALGIIILVAAYHLPQYSGTRLVAVTGLLAGFGAAGLSLTYLLERLFTDEMLALQRLNTAYFLVGYLGFVATWIIDLILIFTQPARLRVSNTWVKFMFRLLSPHFCFSKGVYDISQTYKSDIPLPVPHETNPWSWNVWGSPMVHMASQAVVYFTLAVLLDCGAVAATQHAARQAMHWLHHNLISSKRAQQRIEGEESTPLMQDTTMQQLDDAPASYAGHVVGPGSHAQGGQVSAQQQQQVEDEDVVQERVAVQEGLKTDASQGAVHPLARWFSLPQLRSLLQANGDGYGRGCFSYGSENLLASGCTAPCNLQGENGVVKRYHAGPLAALRGAHDIHAIQAVKGLWLGIPSGECFGLLGVNGAGKTTTFNMLTGEVQPDAGDAHVCGFSVTSQLAAARHQLGYCPQFESLLVALTPTEVLTLYARLRGVPAHATRALVQQLLTRLGLHVAAHRPCGTLSGGNKRKLALGVALVGDPAVTLLDEPSTGVDPGARRSMWSLLKSEVMGEGHALVLTSHSMEECEALCDRLAIMVAGCFACLGSCQHLKARFGGGYVLHIKAISSVDDVAQALRLGPCPEAVLAEAHGTEGVIHIPRESMRLAELFEWLEAHRVAVPPAEAHHDALAAPPASMVPVVTSDGQHGVLSYALSQATLESVFMHMAHQG